MSKHLEKRNCDNRYYIPNLTTSLKKAMQQNDIPAIISLASELERFKVLCGYTPAIRLFEASLKTYGQELNLLDRPEIRRALDTIPLKTCSNCCGSEPSNQTQRPSGISYMANCALGIQNTPTPEQTAPEPPSSEFTRMVAASSKGKKPDVVERQFKTSDIIQRHMPTDFEYQLPEICNETCFIKRHCGAYPSQVGSLCVKRTEQYANRTFIHKEEKSE